jgi:hypothetical protein
MKAKIVWLAAAAVVAFVSFSSADSKHAAAPKTTLKGEVVDMGCYMAHEAHGAKHKECGAKCVAGGMPMGLLTSNGKPYRSRSTTRTRRLNSLGLIDEQVEVSEWSPSAASSEIDVDTAKQSTAAAP